MWENAERGRGEVSSVYRRANSARFSNDKHSPRLVTVFNLAPLGPLNAPRLSRRVIITGGRIKVGLMSVE